MIDNTESKAYVTVLTNKNYLLGVLILADSLDKILSKYPLYVLVPKNLSNGVKKYLLKKNINIITMNNFSDDVIQRNNNLDYWKETLFKLKVFNLIRFSKIVFLDADMIILKNIDYLFNYPHMSAVAAGQILHQDWNRLNSGLMVIEPSKEEYEGIIKNIDAVYDECIAKGQGFGDQDVINAFFKNWPVQKELHLDEGYNVMLGYAGYINKKDHDYDIYVYHFTGAEKPWNKSITDFMKIFLKIMKRSHSIIDVRILFQYRKSLADL